MDKNSCHSGVNDTVKEMQKIKNFLTPYNPSKIELLPYHRMGEHKYTALGMKKIKFDVPDKNVMAKVNDVAGQTVPGVNFPGLFFANT